MKISSAKRKIILRISTFLLMATLMVIPGHPAQAAIWPGIDPIITRALDTVWETLKSALTGVIKQMGAQMINKAVSLIVSGGSGGPKFITKYEDYLVKKSGAAANRYVNDYLTQVTQGRGSSSSYTPASGFEGVGKNAFNSGVGAYTNYAGQMVEQAKNTVVNSTLPKVTMNVNPSQMFSSGTFKNVSRYGSGINNQWAFNARAEQEKQIAEANARLVAQTKAVAGQGFIGTEKNGYTVTPGSVAKDALTNAQNIGNQVIASAPSMIEAMIGMVVRTVVTNALNEGIGNIQSQIQKQSTNVSNNLQTTRNQQSPSSLFKW